VASQLSMTVVTQTPPQFFSAITDSSGMFQVSGVPTGSFRIVAQDPFRHAGGSFVGILAAHGDAVHQDITLADRLTPIDVPGANGYTYRIGSSGALLYSDDALSSGYSTSYQIAAGASDAGFVSYQFAGDVAATPELDSRQFILRDFNGGYTLPQRTVAGVVVTRKIYAPSGGSFVRYVEIFDNPTPDPVTLDVQVNAQMITTRIAATSSGDAALTAADSWIVTDRPDSARTPAVAHVFAGAHARATVSDAGVAFNSESAPQERWNGVTIPAAGRVAFMHFTTEASDASTAQAAAERLVQLPPDALTGLTPEETAAIVNFDVPAGVPPPH
jgi:hypothetical protein